MNEISGFQGNYRFLSNFWPCKVVFEGMEYPSAENAYQAAKTLDEAQRKQIAQLTAGKAKRAGKKLFPREDWDNIKLVTMELILLDKFSRQPLKQQLIHTGEAHLEETNTWGDTFWGVCDGKGANHLGMILMKVRANLQGKK